MFFIKGVLQLKIQNVGSLERSLQSLGTTEVREGKFVKTEAFNKTLNTLSGEQQRQYIENLAKQIDQQGQKLIKRTDIAEFEKYRSLIRDFMNEVVNSSFEFSKENSYGARGRHRYTATVNTINKKLDNMAKEILDEQSTQVDMLGTMNDIYGLLVDMLL